MSTRAGSATASLRAKQNLVRLLFPNTNASSSQGGHFTSSQSSSPLSSSSSSMDTTAAALSYSDLRTAYLQKVQELHPDKHYCTNHSPSWSSFGVTSSSKTETQYPPLRKSLFQQVQEAWKLYESFAKNSNQCLLSSSKHKPSGNEMTASTEQQSQTAFDANFTMFGVGCSFADNEQERQYRNYIMDQAARGYFTTGEISCPDDTTNQTDVTNHTTQYNNDTQYQQRSFTNNTAALPICNDDLFDASTSSNNVSSSSQKKRGTSSLVSHLIPPHRRSHHHHMTSKKS